MIKKEEVHQKTQHMIRNLFINLKKLKLFQ